MTDFYNTLRYLDETIERFIGEGEGVIPFGPSKNLPEHPGGGRLIPGGTRGMELPHEFGENADKAMGKTVEGLREGQTEPWLDPKEPKSIESEGKTWDVVKQRPSQFQRTDPLGGMKKRHPSGWIEHQHNILHQSPVAEGHEYQVSHPEHTKGEPIWVAANHQHDREQTHVSGTKRGMAQPEAFHQFLFEKHPDIRYPIFHL